MFHARTPVRPLVRHTFVVGLVAIVLAVTVAHATTVAQGTWTKKSFSIAGGWQIIEDTGAFFVVLDDDFKTKKAPDLKIFLSTKPLAELNGKNATEGSILVAPLDSHKGAQRYALPQGVDLGAYKTILVHCEKYAKLWGGAPLA